MTSLATKLSLKLAGGWDAATWRRRLAAGGNEPTIDADADASRALAASAALPAAFLEGGLPLVVDADRTLLKSDLVSEAAFTLLSHHPIRGLLALAALCRGKAALRARIAAETSSGFAPVAFDVAPLDGELVALLRRAKATGRKIYLVSALDRRCLEPLVARLGLFDGVFAGDAAADGRDSAMADALCAAFGEGGYDYVGNGAADMAICRNAHDIVIVRATTRALRRAQRHAPRAQGLAVRKATLIDHFRALRVHQWLKNLLIPVPALAAHQFGPSTIGPLLLAFFAFSLFASSAYLLNDLLDLNNDRRHAIKRKRPFAAGTIPLGRGVLMVVTLLAIAGVLASFLPPRFMLLLAGYYVLTLAYSLRLKREMMVDVLMLACLYGMRLVAGGAAVSVPLSPWLIAFSMFLFLSLAIVKRCTELIGGFEPGGDAPSGRGYQLRDMPVLEAMAVASGYVAALVFALYINSPPVMVLYRSPELLWLICVVLIHWISRVVMLTHRGEMHSDPIVFAATDPGSLISAVAIGAVVLASM